jgi:hypothetical protein
MLETIEKSKSLEIDLENFEEFWIKEKKFERIFKSELIFTLA